MNVLNDTFLVRYDETLRSILIAHPDEKAVPGPIVQIREDALDKMNFLEASRFLGERLLLLIPQMRKRYSDDLAKLRSSQE